jgi:quercetin dioxygenase-like cupin family protein
MIKYMVILILALLCASAIAQPSTSEEQMGNSILSGISSLIAGSTTNNSSIESVTKDGIQNKPESISINGRSDFIDVKENITQVNIEEFAKEHPLDPSTGILRTIVASGKNATIYLVQVLKGGKTEEHYHQSMDEIVYIISGYGFMDVKGQNRSIGESDLIYLPAGTSHSNGVSASSEMMALTIFVPKFNERDRILV